MLTLSVFAVLAVSIAYGQMNCCYPDQWEAMEAIIVGADVAGKPGMMQINMKVSLDATKEAIAIDEKVEVPGQPDQFIKIVQLFKQKEQYMVMNGECSRTKLPSWGPINHCIPDNATMLRQYYYGYKNKLPVTVYSFDIEQQTMEIGVTDECVPTSETIYGNRDGTNFMAVAGIFNVSLGIKDPSVFNVPDICNQAPRIQPYLFRTRRSLFSPII